MGIEDWGLGIVGLFVVVGAASAGWCGVVPFVFVMVCEMDIVGMRGSSSGVGPLCFGRRVSCWDFGLDLGKFGIPSQHVVLTRLEVLNVLFSFPSLDLRWEKEKLIVQMLRAS